MRPDSVKKKTGIKEAASTLPRTSVTPGSGPSARGRARTHGQETPRLTELEATPRISSEKEDPPVTPQVTAQMPQIQKRIEPSTVWGIFIEAHPRWVAETHDKIHANGMSPVVRRYRMAFRSICVLGALFAGGLLAAYELRLAGGLLDKTVFMMGLFGIGLVVTIGLLTGISMRKAAMASFKVPVTEFMQEIALAPGMSPPIYEAAVKAFSRYGTYGTGGMVDIASIDRFLGVTPTDRGTT